MKKLFFVFLFSCFAYSMSFTQVVKMELPEIIQKADIIVRAVVEKTEAKWVTDERGKHIYTIAQARIEESLKGSYPTDLLILEAPGGTVGDITEYVTDSYSFEKGEDVILFLSSNPVRVIGGFQGKYPIFEGKVYVENKEIAVNKFIYAIQFLLKDPNKIDVFLCP